jgi:hypothetical protein
MPISNDRALTRAHFTRPPGERRGSAVLQEGPEQGLSFWLDDGSAAGLVEGQTIWVWYHPCDQFCALGNDPDHIHRQ